jgi:hypothetical protein
MRSLATKCRVLRSILSGCMSGFRRYPTSVGLLAINTRMQNALTARDAKAAIGEARLLMTVFHSMEVFWQKRGAPEAVAFAKRSGTATTAVAKAASEGDFALASLSAKQIAIGCTGCHGTKAR